MVLEDSEDLTKRHHTEKQIAAKKAKAAAAAKTSRDLAADELAEDEADAAAGLDRRHHTEKQIAAKKAKAAAKAAGN